MGGAGAGELGHELLRRLKHRFWADTGASPAGLLP